PGRRRSAHGPGRRPVHGSCRGPPFQPRYRREPAGDGDARPVRRGRPAPATRSAAHRGYDHRARPADRPAELALLQPGTLLMKRLPLLSLFVLAAAPSAAAEPDYSRPPEAKGKFARMWDGRTWDDYWVLMWIMGTSNQQKPTEQVRWKMRAMG